jgi:hypothetical protein
VSDKDSKTKASAPPTGSGPGGRIEISDIRHKLEEIKGDADETVERSRSMGVAVAVAGAVVIVGVAFFLGRRRGKRKSTWVEIRRL